MPDPLAQAQPVATQDPLAQAQPSDPLANAQPTSSFGGPYAAALAGPLLDWLHGRSSSNASVLDPTTNEQAIKNWMTKNLTPSGITGTPPSQNQTLGDKAKTAAKAYVKLATDVAAAPLRGLSGLAQTGVNTIGGIGARTVEAGEKLATYLPGGPSDEDVAQMQKSGAVLSPKDVSNATAALADKLSFSNNPTSSLNRPQTVLGNLQDTAQTLGTYALAPEAIADRLGIAAGLSRRGAVMGGLGLQGYGTGYQQATQAGLDNPSSVAAGMGLTNAAMGGMGYSAAFEPQAAKLAAFLGASPKVAAAAAPVITSLPESALMTAMQDRIKQNFDPTQSGFSLGDFLTNTATIGGLKLAGKSNYAQQNQNIQPSFEFGSGRPAPSSPSGSLTAGDAETQLFNLRNQRLADNAVVNNVQTLFKGISPDARAELSHYYSDLEAGLTPKPLSAEAQAVADHPVFQDALKTLGQRYGAYQAQTGGDEAPNPNHIPRVVTESPGTEPTASGKGGSLSQTTSALQQRTVKAIQDPDGNRTLVMPDGQGGYVSMDSSKTHFQQNENGTLGEHGGSLGEASIREIESQTPIRYRKDAITDLLQGITGVGQATRNIDFINNVKASPLTQTEGQPIPAGFTKLSPQGSNAFPAFNDTAMHPELAQVLEAASNRDMPSFGGGSLVGKALGSGLDFSRGAVNLSFGINPFAHSGFNMPAHALDAAVKFGGLSDPSSAVDAFARASDAITGLRRGVANQDLVSYLNAGGTLMTGNRLIQDPYTASMGEAQPSINEAARVADPNAFDPLNQPGMRKMTDLSTHLTWTPDDTARMGLSFMIADNKGIPLADAVKEANKVYPDYRNLMNRIPGEPKLNGLLHAATKFGGTNFTNYEFKAVGILGRNVLDLINPDILGAGGTRGEAATSLAIKYGTYTALSSMMGGLIQSLTQDPRQEFSGAGSGHLIHQGLQDIQRAGGGTMGVLGAIPTFAAQRVIPGAALNLLLSAGGHGYNGRQASNPTDAMDAGNAIKSILNPALHGDWDAAEAAIKDGRLDDAKRHMTNLLEDQAKFVANSSIYNGGDVALLGSAKTDAASVLSRMFLRGSKGGTNAEQTADMLTGMRASRFPPNANLVAQSNDKLAYAIAMKQNDWDQAEAIAEKGNLKESDMAKLQTRYAGNDRLQALTAQVGTLPYSDAVRVFANASDAEKDALYPVVSTKLGNAYDKLPTPSGPLSDPEEYYRSGPQAQFRESKAVFDMASASMPNSTYQAQDPLAKAKPVASPSK